MECILSQKIVVMSWVNSIILTRYKVILTVSFVTMSLYDEAPHNEPLSPANDHPSGHLPWQIAAHARSARRRCPAAGPIWWTLAGWGPGAIAAGRWSQPQLSLSQDPLNKYGHQSQAKIRCEYRTFFLYPIDKSSVFPPSKWQDLGHELSWWWLGASRHQAITGIIHDE